MKQVERKQDTHIVIKVADARKYLNKEGRDMLACVLGAIDIGRESDGKTPNSYVVCNVDEPYSEAVLQTILDGEARKPAQAGKGDENA